MTTDHSRPGASNAEFERFFDDNFPAIVNDLLATDPDRGLRRARSAFATAYRFWAKVTSDEEAAALVHAELATQSRRHSSEGPVARARGRLRFDTADLPVERRRVVALGRRRRLVGQAGLAVMGGLAVAAELLIARR